jgi:hypothetical protein
MGKSAPAPPPAPDYVGAAQAQGQANLAAAQQSAILSNPNFSGPLGSQTVSYSNYADPNTGQSYLQPNITQQLTPEAQQALAAQQRVQAGLGGLGEKALGTAGDVLSSQFTPQNTNIQTGINGYGDVQGAPNLGLYGSAQGGVPAPNLQKQIDTSNVAALPVNAGVTGQQALLSRLQPQIDQRDAALRQQLANQGISQGSEAYTNAMRDENNANNDLYTQAALNGLNLDFTANAQGMNNAMNAGGFANTAQLNQFGAGLQNAGLYNSALGQNQGAALAQQQAANAAQNQQYNQALQGAQFGNQAALQNWQQQLAMHNQPLNQITALMSGSQVQMPQFQQYQGQNVQAAPLFNATQAQGNYAQNIYGQQVAAYNSGMQGLGSVLGAGAGMFQFAPIALSDVRLKSNIVRVGTHPLGIGIYEYDILGERARGVMAHEVEKVLPEAVLTLPSGFKAVNYGMLQ